MSEKIPFSVSDRKKLDNCLCMRCTEPTCLMLDGKCCNLLIAPKSETKKMEEKMKDFNNTKIIGIDHGYGNIKTANCCFGTGILASDKEPVFK